MTSIQYVLNAPSEFLHFFTKRFVLNNKYFPRFQSERSRSQTGRFQKHFKVFRRNSFFAESFYRIAVLYSDQQFFFLKIWFCRIDRFNNG